MKTLELTIKEYLEKIENNEIETCPTIQRIVVYDNRKQSFVIDSILNDILLPCFYLGNDKNEKNAKHQLIDGLQRTTSIQRFFSNELAWINDEENTQIIYNDLTDEQKDKFLNYKLSFNIVNGSKDDIRETFYRINTCGEPLSNWEVLWSEVNINGEISTFLSELKNSTKQYATIFGDNDKRGNTCWKILQVVSQTTSKNGITKYCDNNKMKHWVNIANDFKLTEKCDFINRCIGKDYNINIYIDIFIWIKYYPIILKINVNQFNMTFNKKVNEIMMLNNHNAAKDITSQEYKVALKLTVYSFLNLNGDLRKNDETPMTDDSLRKFAPTIKKHLLSTLDHNKTNNTYKCPICGEWDSGDNFTVDHNIPFSRGGRTNLKNAIIMCHRCNSKKSNS